MFEVRPYSFISLVRKLEDKLIVNFASYIFSAPCRVVILKIVASKFGEREI